MVHRPVEGVDALYVPGKSDASTWTYVEDKNLDELYSVPFPEHSD
jgi:hypothetical protein